MLIKITTSCHGECLHCLDDCKPSNLHMSKEVFEDTLRFAKRHNVVVLILAGGEPLEHPDFFELLDIALKYYEPEQIVIATNGYKLDNTETIEKLIASNTNVQVTHVKGLYTKALPEKVIHDNVVYVDEIEKLIPLGKAKGFLAGQALDKSYKIISAPSCFNFRSLTCHSHKPFDHTIAMLQANGKFCAPAVLADGKVILGESVFCDSIGTIYSEESALVHSILSKKPCNRCGLCDQLLPAYKKAIRYE